MAKMNKLLAEKLNIGLIPDGTRRWSRNNGKSYQYGYFQMAKSIETSVDHFFDQGAHTISIYLLSKENLLRPKDELKAVFEAEIQLMENLAVLSKEKYQFDIIFAGDLTLLPEQPLAKINTFIKPEKYSRKVYLCMAYSPIDEIFKCLSTKMIDNPEDVLAHFWVPEKLDVVIRTSGEARLSNFLPIQSSYAELFFLDKFINDISREDLTTCLLAFHERKRRFGK